MPPNFLTCTAVLLSEFLRCHSTFNRQRLLGMVLYQEITRHPQKGMDGQLVEGSTHRVCTFQQAQLEERSRSWKTRERPALWNQGASHGHRGVPRTLLNRYRGGFFPTLRFCLHQVFCQYLNI